MNLLGSIKEEKDILPHSVPPSTLGQNCHKEKEINKEKKKESLGNLPDTRARDTKLWSSLVVLNFKYLVVDN